VAEVEVSRKRAPTNISAVLCSHKDEAAQVLLSVGADVSQMMNPPRDQPDGALAERRYATLVAVLPETSATITDELESYASRA
jgi:hypothetical protein